MKNKFLIICLCLLVFIIALLVTVDNPARRYLLSLVYQETITPDDLKISYNEKRLKILIVPGHDNEDSGAEYRGTKEANLNLAIAAQLYKLLSANEHFVVSSTRDFNSGEYTKTFSDFFQSQKDQILTFRNEKKSIFDYFLKTGELASKTIVNHNFAPSEVALRLHGINLWANENDVDLTLHVHVNDYGGRKYNKYGIYHGFSIYVPESQYPNSRASKELAQSLFRDLKKSMSASDMPKEKDGVIEDQELIAIGSYASRNGAAVLIEYGYIYDQHSATVLAERTYDGLINYLEPDRVAFK